MSSKATIRMKLRDELTNRFVPALRELGFDGPNRIAGNSLKHAYRRVVSDGTQCLFISFDKWQRPRFALDFWIEPPDGMEALRQHGGQFVQGRAIPGWGRDTNSWFCADRPLWHLLFGLTSSREQQAVSSAIGMLPEIEGWWHDHKATKHITVIPSTFRPGDDSNVA